MPRTSRTVAQRLGSGNKPRKRRVQRTGEAGGRAATPPVVEEILDEAVAEQTAAAPRRPTPVAVTRRAAPAAAAARPAPTRRAYAEYGVEYRYVWQDLRRIALIAGSLLLLLIVLSFFIR
jgi:hypothetical protein